MENERGQQFMPFAALTGYYSLVAEKEIYRETRRELCEDELERLQYKFQQIRPQMVVQIKYYDKVCYKIVKGRVTGIDKLRKTITIIRDTFFLKDILEIDGEGIVDLE